MYNKIKKILSLVLSVSLFFQQSSFAQVAAELNIAGYFSKIGTNPLQERFRPAHLRYFSYDNLQDNFKIQLDNGDIQIEGAKKQETAKTLLGYFLIGVALPDSMFWVNLRPDSDQEVIDAYLEKTDVGRIMLEADLELKKDTARYTSPQASEGWEYWNKLYQKAAELYGNDTITIPTLTRPWIVPGEIIVRESKESAYVYKATLKVMLEQDYLKDSAVYNFKDERAKALNEYSSQLIREMIIPQLTKEVNSAKKYSSLRQVYYSLILSRWFKSRFTGKTGTYASLINTQDLTNLTSSQPWSKTDYFKQYQKSFTDGEYNIKEQVTTPTGQVIRSYFSGGINVTTGAINTQNGAMFLNDNAPRKLGEIIGGKAELDLQTIDLKPDVAGSPIENSDEKVGGVEVNINKIDKTIYIERLRPILQDPARNVLDEIKRLDGAEKLSQIFPVMEILKTKFKDKEKTISVFRHTLGLIEELFYIENNNFDEFTKKVGRGKISEELFGEYNKLFREVAKIKEDRELIYLIALLHDAGESVKTPGHPLIGAGLVKPWLKEIGFSDELINKVVSIIRSHVDLGTLYFAERTPGYLIFNSASLGNLGYVKVLSLLTFVDAEASITEKKAEFYAKIGKDPQVSLNEDFFVRRLEQFSSEKEKVRLDDKLNNEKYNEANGELGKLENIMSVAEYEKFKETVRSGIEVFDYGIFFFRGFGRSLEGKSEGDNLGGASLVKMLLIVYKLIGDKAIKRVNFTAPSGEAPAAAKIIDENILKNWELKNIVGFSSGNLKDELERRGLAIEYKSEQLFIHNWEYSKSSLSAEEIIKVDLPDRTYDETGYFDGSSVSTSAGPLPSGLVEELKEKFGDKVKILEWKSGDVVRSYEDDRGMPVTVFAFKTSLNFKKDMTGLVKEVIEKYYPNESFLNSSPIELTPKKTGGIDFRALPMNSQLMGSFSGLNFKLPQLSQVSLDRINVDKELGQINNMVRARIIPSGARLKELVAACAQKGEIDRQVDNLLLCLADILKLEEENAVESSPELKEALVIIDSQS